MDHLLSSINKLKPWQVACIIAAVGLGVFFTGLSNPFQNDDTFQIVNNPPVHSIANLPLFLQSSTYWNGQQLTGAYYRPMMTTVFSIIYTFVGAHPLAYHLVQLSLYIAGAFVLYLIFRRFFKPVLALALALIFLVHPLNSQVVYSIATMQDVLFFFFGILAIWLLMRSTALKSLWAVALGIFLSLLSKESAVVFAALAVVYLFWFQRERLRTFIAIMVAPAVIYLVLKIHAVGLIHLHRAAPIDDVSLIGRLLTAPSIILFYITKFIFPWKLATTYYWVNPTQSVVHVLIPLVIDLVVIGLLVYLGVLVHRKLSKSMFRIYCFFATWTTLGLILCLQIIPLDMTACETWFYFVMAGLLGMIGVAIPMVPARMRPKWLVLVLVVLCLGVLGLRSAVRGTDYQSQYTIAVHDVASSDGDFSAMDSVAGYLIDHGNYTEGARYARSSIAIYPGVSNYNLLGVALEQSGDYAGAVQAYSQALKYNNLSLIYENLGLILIVYSNPNTTNQLFQRALAAYPQDFKLWFYDAIFEGALGSTANAKAAIINAAKYGTVPPTIYDAIVQDQPFALPLLGRTVLVR